MFWSDSNRKQSCLYMLGITVDQIGIKYLSISIVKDGYCKV